MATFTPSTNTTSYAGQLSPSATGYLNKKWGLWNNTAEDEGQKGIADTLNDVNRIISYKGGNQISDISQLDTALSPLIAKRNAGGIGNLLGTVGKIALPIALSFIAPGLGTALGAGLGLSGTAATMAGSALVGAGTSGLTSALTGGKVFKDALTGGVTAGATAGLSSALGGGNQVLAQSGPLKGQLVTPGVSSAVATSGPMAGQVITPNMGSGIGTSISNYNPSMLQRAASGIARVNDTVKGLGDEVNSALGLPAQAATQTATNSAPVWGGTTSGGITMGNPLTTALSGYMEYQNQGDIAKKLRQGQQNALAQLQPYLNSGAAANTQLSQALAAGFNPGDLSSDAGYQFRLNQGQDALNKSLAARGLGQSGAALKAAQEYGQNFANNEYTDAYNRWLANNTQLANAAGQGQNAANNASDIMANIGTTNAYGSGRQGSAISNTLSSMLSGRGIIGFDSNGDPVYG